MGKLIDTERFSVLLRSKGFVPDRRLVLIANLAESEQEQDLTLPPNCQAFGRIHHFNRDQGNDWPANPLPIDPAVNALALPQCDSIQVQVFQTAMCAWRCWYCFVDFDRLSADRSKADYKTVDELLDMYCRESPQPPIIDLSGGQPDLVPEWNLWFADAVRARQMDRVVYLWSDDNLSNDYLWRFLTPLEVQRLASYPNYGRVGCFKGFDSRSFSFNTRAEPQLFGTQFQLMRRLVDAGFDVYGYATFTSDSDERIADQMNDFVDRLQSEVHPLFPLRTAPLKVRAFTPTKGRMKPEHHRALEIQSVAVAAWSEELKKRFSIDVRSKKVFEHKLL